MARPAVDLPDPLNDSGTGDITSADDLLAQLAGEEIDRLLAEEADDVTTPAATPQPQNIDRRLQSADRGAITTTPATPKAAASTLDDAVLDATEEALDNLFKDLDDEPTATPAPTSFSRDPKGSVPSPQPTPKTQQELAAAAVLADPSPVPAKPTPSAQPASAADALAAELEADEAAHSAALQRMKQPAAAAAPAPTSVPATPAPAADLDPAPTEVDESEVVYERVPLIVRILEWVNAPLAFLPLQAREAVGKIALVTTVNAIAILTYVLLFRHR